MLNILKRSKNIINIKLNKKIIFYSTINFNNYKLKNEKIINNNIQINTYLLPKTNDGTRISMCNMKLINNNNNNNIKYKNNPIILIHGAIENNKIFYSQKMKGLGPYLVNNNYDIYLFDLRGRGESVPTIKEAAKLYKEKKWPLNNKNQNQNKLLYKDGIYGQTEAIVEDIPLYINFVKYLTKSKHVHIITHSWGGVLVSSTLVRFPELIDSIKSQTYFGTKRYISVWNFERLILVELFWNRILLWIAKYIFGYVPCTKLGIGSDDETYRSILESKIWVTNKEWIDPFDKFNYNEAAKKISNKIKNLPTWSITGKDDHVLGNPKDVKLFFDEVGYSNQSKFTVLGKENGNLKNYDHINILTSKKCENDHFPKVLEWIDQFDN